MSKIGKKYTLQTVRSPESEKAGDFIKNISSWGVKVSLFEEKFNNSRQLYEGKIVFSGENKNIKRLDKNLKSILPSGRVSDTKFSFDAHYEELKEIKTNYNLLSNEASLLKYKGPLEYNFLIKNYENFLDANPNLSETALPNFYSVLKESIEKENYLGFDGTSFFESPASVINVNAPRNEPERRVIPSKMFVNGEMVSLDTYLEKYSGFKEQFPFYTDIVFDTHEQDERSICSILHQKNLLTGLLETLVTEALPTELIYEISDPINARSLRYVNCRVLSVDQYLRKHLEESLDNDFTFIFDINQRIDNKSRTFLEVLRGDKEYTEVIGYNLRKYDGNTSTLIQEWYFPNISTEQYKWIDSQIKYNKLYTYKLDPIILSFTTEYEFSNFIYSENDFTVEFINRPVVKVYILQHKTNNPKENLGSSYTNKLLDFPPLEPEIEVVPYIGVPNKIKLNFNTSVGSKTVPSIDFSPLEDIKKDELRLSQNKDTNSPLLTFQSDEPAEIIYVYRTDIKPSSYGDFSTNLLQALPTNGSAGASFIDSIQPNKKYYYIAKCVDYHENISNPTPVYEVEVQQDGNLILPIIKVVDFDRKEKVKQESKSCKRYIKIQPAIRHRVPNEGTITADNIDLGLDETTPWNKTFKLRLTSKSSGKKIDVNFTFTYNKPS